MVCAWSEQHSDRSVFFSSSHGAAAQSSIPETSWAVCSCGFFPGVQKGLHYISITFLACRMVLVSHFSSLEDQEVPGVLFCRNKCLIHPFFRMHWAACTLWHWLLLLQIFWLHFTSFALQLLSLSFLAGRDYDRIKWFKELGSSAECLSLNLVVPSLNSNHFAQIPSQLMLSCCVRSAATCPSLASWADECHRLPLA